MSLKHTYDPSEVVFDLRWCDDLEEWTILMSPRDYWTANGHLLDTHWELSSGPIAGFGDTESEWCIGHLVGDGMDSAETLQKLGELELELTKLGATRVQVRPGGFVTVKNGVLVEP